MTVSKDMGRVEHTPTPWQHLGLTPHDQIVNENLDIIAIIPHNMPRVEYEANARLIVRAVNRDHHFNDLVKALRQIADLRYAEDANEPFDEAIWLADKALSRIKTGDA